MAVLASHAARSADECVSKDPVRLHAVAERPTTSGITVKTRIPIKRYVDDPLLTWEERYARLLTHHEEETKFLISTIEELEAQVHDQDKGKDGVE